jgi:RNA polymerase sigma factor (sigma-70 family)
MEASRAFGTSSDLDDIYRRHGPAVLRRARQILGSHADAEEALQDVFLSLARAPHQFDGRSSMTTFLYSVTTHLCLNRLRDHRRRAAILRGQARVVSGGAADAPDGERAAILRQLIARMPDELATPAVHHYFDEMTHEEIAELLGCSRRHVGDLIERTRAWVAAEVGE